MCAPHDFFFGDFCGLVLSENTLFQVSLGLLGTSISIRSML